MTRWLPVLALVGLLRCGSSAPTDALSSDPGGATSAVPAAPVSPLPDAGTSPGPGWVVASREDFESLAFPPAAWRPDEVPDDGPQSDEGLLFSKQGIVAPKAYRATVPFGASSWLTAESYTRSEGTPFAERLDVVSDPADPRNHVLRLASPAHTDATVIRPSQPLPPKYRVSLRIGFIDFGDGKSGGLNGYKGGETPQPWLSGDATQQNGVYWLTILDAQPRPHNNVWIHHHRKVVMDTDNNVPPWMESFDGSAFHLDGQHPVMMFALDGTADPHELWGPPFLSWAANAWQPSGAVRAVDHYLPGEWYRATIERDGTRFTMELSGRFQYGGETTYRTTIDAKANCVWHYNRTPDEAASRCANARYSSTLGAQYPYWAADTNWPDWFMFGDPHENYYAGSVLYDDVQLEVWRD